MQIDPRTALRRRTLPLLKRISVLLLAWLLWGNGEAVAQLIPIRTAPVATGSQFQLFPAERHGMGDVSIAVDDPLGDAFVNPAKAGRLNDTWTFTSPTHYTVSGPDEAASTATVGAITRRGR